MHQDAFHHSESYSYHKRFGSHLKAPKIMPEHSAVSDSLNWWFRYTTIYIYPWCGDSKKHCAGNTTYVRRLCDYMKRISHVYPKRTGKLLALYNDVILYYIVKCYLQLSVDRLCYIVHSQKTTSFIIRIHLKVTKINN